MPDDLKHLHPEDRIKKLKELEKKRKEEIAKAQEEIKKSKQDIKKSEEELLMERQQKEKEFLAIMEKLEKERVEKKKGKEETEDNSDETNETNKSALSETSSKLESQLHHHHHHHHHHQPQQSDANNLENQLRQEQVSLQQQNSVYALSKEPMQELYKEMNTLYKAVEDKGYLSQEEEKKVRYLASAVEEKIKAHDEGNYSFTDKVAQAADITQKIGSKLKKMYHS